MCVYVIKYVCVHMCVCMLASVCVCVCTHVCVFVFVCTPANTHMFMLVFGSFFDQTVKENGEGQRNISDIISTAVPTCSCLYLVLSFIRQ